MSANPPPAANGPSGAPYIIICSGRSGLAVAKNYADKVVAVACCAAELACYMGLRYRASMDPADMERLAHAQHGLMDLAQHKQPVDEQIAVVFSAMDYLEHKYAGVGY